MSNRPGSRLLFLVASVLLATLLIAQEPQPYSETIDVVRYIVNVRVANAAGRAITDLAPEDFRVKIGGSAAVVESATWVSYSPRAAAPHLSENPKNPATDIEESPGRLIVLYILTDFGRDARRMAGQLRFNPMADQILAELAPNDRVAVLQHDSHFKMRLDFSTDRAAIRKAIRDSIRIERLPLPEPLPGPSLARHLDHDAMRRSASEQTSLLLIANALHQIEGTKLMIMAGWGLGERAGGFHLFLDDWKRAVTMLNRDKVPIFTINTGVGGSLTYGLVASSVETGGAYVGWTMQMFPQQATIRMIGALAGYYELMIRTDKTLTPGSHPLDIRTRRRGVAVIAPNTVIVEQHTPDNIRWQVVEEVSPLTDEAVAAQANTWTLFATALRHLRNEEPEEAEKVLDEVIAIDDKYALAWYERGMLAAGRNDSEAARRDFGKYLELEPRGRYAAEVREMLRRLP